MSRAKESRTIRHVEVFDTPSNMGGSFTVSIVRELDAERVEVRVWYGHPTPMGLGAVEGMGRLQVRNQPCRPSQRSQNGIMNSPEFRRHPRVTFSAAFRTRQVTAFRFWRACASGCRTSRCNRTRLAGLRLSNDITFAVSARASAD